MSPDTEAKQAREHFDKYERLSRLIGVEKLIPLVPASKERIREAMEAGDVHLNTIPLAAWDKAIGYGQFPIKVKCPCCGGPKYEDQKPPDVFRWQGLSPAECCCILKHVAIYYIAEGRSS